jgi:hypothetical protein
MSDEHSIKDRMTWGQRARKVALRTVLPVCALALLLWLVMDAFTFLAIGRRPLGDRDLTTGASARP